MSEKNVSFVGKETEAEHELNRVMGGLEFLADALKTTGNNRLAVELVDLAAHIENAKKIYGEVYTELFNRWGGAVEQGGQNMMNGMLAVIMSKSGEKND